MARDPVTVSFEFRYRVQDIIQMHLHTIPRTPFFISFVALIYILFLFFFLRQDLMGMAIVYAAVPTLGCGLIGLIGATIPVLFSDQVKSPRYVKLTPNGIEVTLVGETSYIGWQEITRRFDVSGHIFLKLDNGSHVMIPAHARSQDIDNALTIGTKKPA